MSNQSKMKGKLIKTILLILLVFTTNLFAQKNGKITGNVIDQETGDPIIGANIMIDGTMLGAASDIDGMFVINAVPEGNYAVTLSCIGYAKKTVTDVKITSGQVEKINITLSPESYETEEVTITAKLLKNTDAVLLKDRQKSNSISDAISNESISRSGSGNAADAITKVTGTSVVSGKYVYIRGLGDRYSSTHLNGTELPSADPDVKSFNLDLFPSNLLDNIVTIKSFTPDKPGNFSGGLVNVATKDYPEKFNFRFSSSTAYNSNTTFNKNYLTYPTSSTDWLGYDNGSREIPNLLKDQNVYIPSPNEARRNHDLALRLDELTKSFNPEMSPIQSKAPMDQSYNLSIGDQLSIFGNPLGYIASLSYSRKYSFYENGQKAKWELSGNYDEVNDLYNYYNFSDTKGSE
ncbi:MAG: carboxypeptidase-like regulatory domain-containing protein, partial [Ignavibacteriales bacterium]|nr:carboxypeptidase-like regulatory domain-containing protein [Ignavibacteriales bacterium]